MSAMWQKQRTFFQSFLFLLIPWLQVWVGKKRQKGKVGDPETTEEKKNRIASIWQSRWIILDNNKAVTHCWGIRNYFRAYEFGGWSKAKSNSQTITWNSFSVNSDKTSSSSKDFKKKRKEKKRNHTTNQCPFTVMSVAGVCAAVLTCLTLQRITELVENPRLETNGKLANGVFTHRLKWWCFLFRWRLNNRCFCVSRLSVSAVFISYFFFSLSLSYSFWCSLHPRLSCRIIMKRVQQVQKS